MISRKLKIAPDGNHLLGGLASYALDPKTGKVHYAATVQYSLFGSHTSSTAGDYSIYPELLKSANAKLGEVIKLGKVLITISKIDGKFAYADLVVAGLGQGTAVLSLENEFLELRSIVADIKYSLISAHLVAV